MVCAGAGDDLVPDDSLVGGVGGRACAGIGPLCGDVDEDLLGIPTAEEGGEVGLEGELDDGVFLLGGGVVVRTALDDLDRVGDDDAGGGEAGCQEIGEGDEGRDDESDGREGAERGLEAVDGIVHGGGDRGLDEATQRFDCLAFTSSFGGLLVGWTDESPIGGPSGPAA